MNVRRMIALFLVTLLAMTVISPTSAQRETTTLTGTLTEADNMYFVDGVEADFGPAWYLSDMTATVDYDGDGVTETLEAEFDGLVGTEVTSAGHIGRGDDVDILTVNGAEYRDPNLEPAPWAGGPLRADASSGEDPQAEGPPVSSSAEGSPANQRVSSPAVADDDRSGLPAFVHDVRELLVNPGNSGEAGPPDGRGGPPSWVGDDSEDD